MRSRTSVLAIVFVLLSCGITAFGQRTPKTSTGRPVAELRRPDYELHLKIAADGQASISVETPDKGKLTASGFQSLVADLPGGGGSSKNAFPAVVLTADPQLSMAGFWNAIRPIPRGKTSIRLRLSNGKDDPSTIDIAIPWEPAEPNKEPMPDPLFLLVKTDDDGTLRLNGEEAGTLGDAAALSQKLKNIFTSREENGVLRPGSNDIERSVTIVAPANERKFADVLAVAQAIRLAGGDRISLVMEGPNMFVVQTMTLVPDLPPPTPKRIRKP